MSSASEQLPVSVSELIRAFARAAGASHLAAEATPLLADARRQKALLPLSVLDDEVRSARDVVGSQADTEEKGADDNVTALPTVMTQAADMRLRMSRGEKVTSGAVSQANSDATELTTRARLTSLASTVRALKEKADSVGLSAQKGPGGSWSVAMLTTMVLDLIYEEEKPHSQFEGADKLHGGWLDRLEIAKKNGAKEKHDPNAEMQAAVKYINGEMASMDAQLGTLKEFIKWSNKQIADQELKNLLQSIAWQMGLMIVTGEIAGAGLAAVRGVALAGEIAEDVRGASLLWRGAEVLTHAALQTAASGASGGEISGSAFAENALGMLLTSAAMKPFKSLLEGDAVLEQAVEKELSTLGKIGKVAKVGAKLGTEAAIDLSSGVIGAGVAHAIVHNTPMGIASRDEWMTQGLALTASAFVGAHTQQLHARIEVAAHDFRAAKMNEAADRLDAIAARAAKLQARASTASTKKGVTPDEAGAMLIERHEILAQEHAIYQEAHASPGADKKNAAELSAPSADFIEVPLQLNHLSSVVDGLSYEGSGRDINKALKDVAAQGIEVNSARDDKGVWTITAADRKLTIKELDFKAGTDHVAAKEPSGHPSSIPPTAGAVGAFHGASRSVGDPGAIDRQIHDLLPRLAARVGGTTKGGVVEVKVGGKTRTIRVTTEAPLEAAPGNSPVARYDEATLAGQGEILVWVSDRAAERHVERALAHELAEIAFRLNGGSHEENALIPGGKTTELSGDDVGRLAELETIASQIDDAKKAGDRQKENELLQDAQELIVHLGLDKDSPRTKKLLGNKAGMVAELRRESGKAVGEAKKRNDSIERVIRATSNDGADQAQAQASRTWANRMEGSFGGDNKAAADFFAGVANRGANEAYMRAADAFASSSKVAPDLKQAVLRHSVSGKEANPTQYLEHARDFAARSISEDALANILDKSMRGKLDLDWLRGTKLTDVELDQLGLRDKLPWNKFKGAAENARTGVTGKEATDTAITANLQIRGVAGEIVARDIPLPEGLKLKGHGARQADGKEPDFELVDRDNHPADLEVKANRPDEWPGMLRDAEQGIEVDALERLVKQLQGSRDRHHKSYLAVSDKISRVSKNRLEQFLAKRGVTPTAIMYLPESEILATAKMLREHLGIPQPSFPAKSTEGAKGHE
jgi:hypothetical protein